MLAFARTCNENTYFFCFHTLPSIILFIGLYGVMIYQGESGVRIQRIIGRECATAASAQPIEVCMMLRQVVFVAAAEFLMGWALPCDLSGRFGGSAWIRDPLGVPLILRARA